MSAPRFYRQCLLERTVGEAVTQTTSYLPERHAKLSGVVRLRSDDGVWTDGWVVRAVGKDRVDEASLPDPHAAIKGHRRQTGDAATR